MQNFYPAALERAKLRARALLLLLLYSGLRISDAVKLERKRVNLETGQLMIRMEKTRHPVYVRLHPYAIAVLKALSVESAYFFWSGRGSSPVRSEAHGGRSSA
jgi:site-specific recombinase XerD